MDKLLAWVFSRQGAHDLGALAVALTGLYEGLKAAGVL